MPKLLDEKDENDPKKQGDASAEDESLNSLNSPELDEETGKPKNRAVSSFKQAHALCKRQHDRAEDGRLKSAAVVADKYGGSNPYRQSHLVNSGQGWRSNYSTNPLASVVDRAVPQLKDPIKQADFLTYSALPAMRKDASEKTRKFRTAITRLFRSWPAWDDCIDQITQDNYLFGNTPPGWIDDDWRPRAWRYNEAFLPEGTGQHASQVQFIVYRQPVLLHDFLLKIADPEIAEAAGYDMEGCIKAANEAAGLRGSGGTESHFDNVDAIRENATLEKTYEGDTKIVWLYHLLVREYTGGVNLWTTAQKGGHAIRSVEGIHEKMEDACTLFTLQAGNNRFYGSKGSGRMLTNFHIALDRKRCFDNDKAYVAGLPIWKVKGKDVNAVQMHFRAPFLMVTGDAELAQETVQFSFNDAQLQDEAMVRQMEAIAGSFIPPEQQDQGSPSTKIADAERIKRQLAVKDGVLGRFFRQFGDLVGAMQRKACCPDNLKEALRIYEEAREKEKSGIRVIAFKIWKWIKEVIPGIEKQAEPMSETRSADPEAVEMLVGLLQEGLSVEDIAELTLSPATNSVDEQPEVQDQNVIDLIGGVTQNPQLSGYFDHKAMAKKLATIKGGADIADEFLLQDQPDPSDQAANQAGELQEWLVMLNGDAVHAAQFQNHRVRRAAIIPKLQPIIETLMQAPTVALLQLAKLVVPHYGEHLQMDMETPKDALAGEIQSWQQMQQVVEQAEKQLMALAKKAQAAGAASPDQLPPPMPGGAQPPTGMGGGGPDGTLAATQGDLERAKLNAETERTAADTFIRAHEIQIEHRKLDLKQQELEQKGDQHLHDSTLATAGDIAQQMHAAGRAGEEAGSQLASDSLPPVATVNPPQPTAPGPGQMPPSI